jgi:hypothetical protein
VLCCPFFSGESFLNALIKLPHNNIQRCIAVLTDKRHAHPARASYTGMFGNTALHEAYQQARSDLIAIVYHSDPKAMDAINNEGLLPLDLNPKCDARDTLRRRRLFACHRFLYRQAAQSSKEQQGLHDFCITPSCFVLTLHTVRSHAFMIL